MTDNREFEGADLEEALRTAADALRVAESELHYEILDTGRRGLFGIGQKSVRIRIKPPLEVLDEEADAVPAAAPAERAEAEPERKPRGRKPRRRAKREPEAAPQAEIDLDPDGQAVVQTVQRMLDLMQIDVRAVPESLDGGLSLKIDGADRKRLTAKDGEVLFAMQFLLNRMARRTWPDVGRIHLVCDGKRRQRDDELVELTKEVAQQVSRTGKTKRLHAMNAYERRLVHLTVREYTGLSSSSDGRGALKRVRISKVKNELEPPRRR